MANSPNTEQSPHREGYRQLKKLFKKELTSGIETVNLENFKAQPIDTVDLPTANSRLMRAIPPVSHEELRRTALSLDVKFPHASILFQIIDLLYGWGEVSSVEFPENYFTLIWRHPLQTFEDPNLVIAWVLNRDVLMRVTQWKYPFKVRGNNTPVANDLDMGMECPFNPRHLHITAIDVVKRSSGHA
jgi:hypothetical protein